MKYFYDCKWGRYSHWKEVPENEHAKSFLLRYVNDEYVVYDCDISGEEKIKLAIRDGKIVEYVTIVHEWWWEIDRQGHYDNLENVYYMNDEHEYFEIPSANRDWLILKK